MNSSILSRLETEISRYCEDRVDMTIVTVFMSISFYTQLQREYHECARYTDFATSSIPRFLQFVTCYGTVTIKHSALLGDHEMIFESDIGERLYPLDEEINKILLGY